MLKDFTVHKPVIQSQSKKHINLVLEERGPSKISKIL